jgi:hypothetical protein
MTRCPPLTSITAPSDYMADDRAPAEPPDEPGALQVVQRARWMAGK